MKRRELIKNSALVAGASALPSTVDAVITKTERQPLKIGDITLSEDEEYTIQRLVEDLRYGQVEYVEYWNDWHNQIIRKKDGSFTWDECSQQFGASDGCIDCVENINIWGDYAKLIQNADPDFFDEKGGHRLLEDIHHFFFWNENAIRTFAGIYPDTEVHVNTDFLDESHINGPYFGYVPDDEVMNGKWSYKRLMFQLVDDPLHLLKLFHTVLTSPEEKGVILNQYNDLVGTPDFEYRFNHPLDKYLDEVRDKFNLYINDKLLHEGNWSDYNLFGENLRWNIAWVCSQQYLKEVNSFWEWYNRKDKEIA